MGASENEITDKLGQAQNRGKGIGGATLLAYRNKTIQLSFRDDRLFILAIYFRRQTEQSSWPQCLEALAAFSYETKSIEVEKWLNQCGIHWRRISVDGEEIIEAQAGTQFRLELGHLASIQITSTATSCSRVAGVSTE
jgi:hypothetical protein